MEEKQLQKIEGWFQQLSQKIEQEFARLGQKIDNRFDAIELALKELERRFSH